MAVLELDSEAGMVDAVGALRPRTSPGRARAGDLQPDQVRAIIERAESEGFEFDD